MSCWTDGTLEGMLASIRLGGWWGTCGRFPYDTLHLYQIMTISYIKNSIASTRFRNAMNIYSIRRRNVVFICAIDTNLDWDCLYSWLANVDSQQEGGSEIELSAPRAGDAKTGEKMR